MLEAEIQRLRSSNSSVPEDQELIRNTKFQGSTRKYLQNMKTIQNF